MTTPLPTNSNQHQPQQQQQYQPHQHPPTDYGNPDRFLNASNEHPLWSSFTFWMFSKKFQPAHSSKTTPALEQQQPPNSIDLDSLFDGQSPANQPETTTNESSALVAKSEYEKYLDYFAKIGPFDTVEGFWKLYSYIKRPSSSHDFAYYCFRGDIHPTWEHNQRGGKWVIKLRRNYGPRLFEVALLSMIGNEYNLGEELNGVVLTCKKSEDIVSIWVASQDQTSINRMNQVVKRLIYACYYTFAPGVGGSSNQQHQPSSTSQPTVTALDFQAHQNAIERHHGAPTQSSTQPGSNNTSGDVDYNNNNFISGSTLLSPDQSNNPQNTNPLSRSNSRHQGNNNNNNNNINGMTPQGLASNNFNNRATTRNPNQPQGNIPLTSTNSSTSRFGGVNASSLPLRQQPSSHTTSQSLISNKTNDDDDFTVISYGDDNNNTANNLASTPVDITNNKKNMKDSKANEKQNAKAEKQNAKGKNDKQSAPAGYKNPFAAFDE